jgi:hypothetical protein
MRKTKRYLGRPLEKMNMSYAELKQEIQLETPRHYPPVYHIFWERKILHSP